MYTVSAYDNWEIPNPRFLDEGTFRTPAEAVAAAEAIIRKSLEDLHQENGTPNAKRLMSAYLSFGEVPSIFEDDGDPRVIFRPYVRVRRLIEQITGEALPADA